MQTLGLKIGDTQYLAFADNFFELPVSIVDDSDNSISERAIIEPKCFFESSEYDELDDSICAFDKSTEIYGSGKIKFYFKDVSLHHDNKKVVISLVGKTRNNTIRIEPTRSQPITIIRHKLIIEEDNRVPYTWYKDEGGKDKCIELRVFIVDKDNQRIKTRKVPLKIELIYASGVRVLDQNILSLNQDTRLMIDDHPAVIKLRINEVSTRHQGQLFQVLISPDTAHSPSLGDISSSVVCTAIDVKSKRNHHHPMHHSMPHSLSGAKEKHRSTSLNSVQDAQYSSNKRAKSDPKLATGTTASGYFNNTVPTYASVLSSSQSFTLPSTKSGINELVVGSQSGDLLMQTKPKFKVPPSFEYESTTSNSDVYSCPATIQVAVSNLLQWTHTVMTGLREIQWQQVGYAQRHDGTQDLSQPLYCIPNPVHVINTLCHQYQAYVEDSLQVLTSIQLNGLANGDYLGDDPFHLPLGDKSPRRTGLANLNFMRETSLTTQEFFDNMDKLPLSRQTSFRTICENISSSNPPVLARDNTFFGASLDNCSSDGAGNGVTLSFLNKANFQSTNGSDSDMTVYYILSQSWFANSMDLGLPAFDINKKLLGFYKAGEDLEKFTVPKFYPLTNLPNNTVDDTEAAAISSSLRDLLDSGSETVFTLTRFKSLSDMAEEAIIHDMMRAADSNEEMMET